MNQCASFGADGPAGVADALGKVDCLASDATAVSFGRLFGEHGSFQTALTIILTLYVALLAFNFQFRNVVEVLHRKAPAKKISVY